MADISAGKVVRYTSGRYRPARAVVRPMDDATSPSTPRGSGDETAAAYEAHYAVLEYLALRKFHIPREDVRSVIHDVFVAFLRNRSRIENPRNWLVGAACIQCRLYWRERGRDDVLCELTHDTAPAVLADELAKRVEVSNVLRRLPRKCRELIHLRFFEQYSSQEIAKHYDTTIDYARKLVHRCVLSVREIFAQAYRRRR